MKPPRINYSPAFTASAVLHVGILLAVIIGWSLSRHLTMGPVVPITIVNGPPSDMAQQVESSTPAEASTPTPVEAAAAPPTPPAPPAPTPTPPAQAQPKPTPTPVKPTPAPTRPSPQPSRPAQVARTDPGLDLDALAASLARSPSKPASAPAAGAHGPAHPRAGPVAQAGNGSGDHLSASELDALRSKLEKLWNPNCDVEGAAGVTVKVRMRLNPDGRLIGAPELQNEAAIMASGNAMLIASAQRAKSAVGRGQPYDELNPDHYGLWRDLVFNFNAKAACGRR